MVSTQNSKPNKMSKQQPRKITDKGPDGKPTLKSIREAAELIDEQERKRKRREAKKFFMDEAEMSGDGHSDDEEDMEEHESDREFIAGDDEDLRPELPDRLELLGDGLMDSEEEEELAAEVKENVINAMMHVLDRWRMPYTPEGVKRGGLIANMLLSKYIPKAWDFEAAYLGMVIGDGWEAMSDAPRHIRFEERERAEARERGRKVRAIS